MAKNRGFHLFVWLLIFPVLSSWAQQNRYMVFFSDKEGIPYTIDKPIDYLSEKAIQRRLAQGIAITERDLPVKKAYVEGVRGKGVRTFYTTRWLNGVLVSCEPSTLQEIESLPYVERVEYVAPPAKDPSGGRRTYTTRKNSQNIGIQTEPQLQMIGIDRMHLAGHRGEGITIAVLDSGFPGVDQVGAFDDIDVDLDVSFDFVHHSGEVFGHDDHGTEVLSIIAGQVPDAFTGGAPKATFQLYVTEDVPTEYRIEEYNWLFAAERADSAGADIIHSSLGYYDFDDASMNYRPEQMDGKTAVVTQAAQWAAERGIVVITSAGNEGNIPTWRIITAPSDGEDVLAIGGVNAVGQKTSSSSIGPAADGRIKPDLVALGAGVRVVKASGQISSATGTSLAAPLVTSLAAGVMQRYPGLTARQVVTLLRQTASQAARPDNLLGYGIPNFQAVVNFQNHAPQTDPFEIYPNPVEDSDTLIISPMDPDTFRSCQIEIVSSQGQVLAREFVRFDWLNRTYRTTLAGLPPATYYIRIYSDKKRETFKVVKLR